MSQIIPLTSDGEGHSTVDLNGNMIEFVTRFNYAAACWTLDLIDGSGVFLVKGLMLVPYVNVLFPYTNLCNILGSLVLVEKKFGAYVDPIGLGNLTELIWFAPGEAVWAIL